MHDGPTTAAARAMRWVLRAMGVTIVAALVGGLLLQLETLESSARLTAETETDHVELVLTEASDDALALATLIAQDATLVEPLLRADRNALLERFQGPFEQLRRNHDVTHLHFALPPATSLLRVHAPGTHGDDLTPYRPMLVEAMERGIPLAGFERGRYGASARAVVPVRAVLSAGDSWGERGGEPEQVIGLVDLGFSLDDTLLADPLAGSAVALVTLPSEEVAESVGAPDPVVTSSTFPPEVTLQVGDAAAARALVDSDPAAFVDHDPSRWRLTRTVLPDHLGNPAAVVLVASDISDVRAMRLLSVGATVTMLVLLVGGAATLTAVRRRKGEQLARASASLVRSGQLSRALRLADTEDATLRVLDRALQLDHDTGPARLLLADSSRAHFKIVVDQGFGDGGGDLPSPGRCPAARSGEIQRFEDADALDACPFLVHGGCRAPGNADGTLRCQPLSISGATVGVLQVQTRQGPLDRHTEHQLDDLVRQTGDHLSAVRLQAETTRQAGTDPLTGVSNRRSFDAEAAGRIRSGHPYAVLFADLDRFKQLNDTHGHEVGDRALRLFAGVLRSSLRPDDVIARFGGEEFVVLMDGCDAAQARDAAERVRDDLALALTAGAVPTFTVSVGIADHLASPDPFGTPGLDEVIACADTALLRAKNTGRDRVVLHEVAAPVPVAPA